MRIVVRTDRTEVLNIAIDMDEQKKDTQQMPTNDAGQNAAPESAHTTPPTPAAPTGGETAAVTSGSGMNKMALVISIIVAAAVLGGLYYFFVLGADTDMQNQNAGTNDTAQTEIDDDTLIARVNGTELFGSDLSTQMAQLARAAGVADVSSLDAQSYTALRSQATDAMVNTELIVQNAREEGLAVADAEVDAEYDALIEGIGGEEAAQARLNELGLSTEQFKEDLSEGLLVQKFITAYVDADTTTVTDEEVQSLYDQVSASQENIPPLADVRDQIVAQIQAQKEQQEINALLEALRASADIEVF